MFQLESILSFCIIAHVMAIALADQTFRRRFDSIEAIFRSEIPALGDSWKVKFCKNRGKQPTFHKAERLDGNMVV
jgi:hypothetical protein